MKKIVLIDGNNLMFRSFYATAYNGNMMKNSKGFPTNALYGFISMINKIINEEKPAYIAVAFDIGKNFRKKEYDFYKEGRAKTPDELKLQMPVAKTILEAMGIKYLELEPYEADDIIGTLVKRVEENTEFDATIISSDKDLLQLINYETDVKLLKQTGYIRYNEKTFYDDYGIEPIKIIDLKSLMGDSSDNIPGVKGIGEKGALKLLQEYGSLDGIYANIDSIKGSTHDKLVADKENAYISYKLATIYKEVPLEVNLENLKYNGADNKRLKEIYTDLEFVSLLKNLDVPKEEINIKYINVNSDINIILEDTVAFYLECDNEIYTKSNIIGACVCDSKYSYYFDKDNINRLPEVLNNKNIITYDYKKTLYFYDIKPQQIDDILVSSYLLGNNKDDINYLLTSDGIDLINLSELLKKGNNEDIIKQIVIKANYLFNNNSKFIEELKKEDMYDLYKNIEIPLIRVLSNLEKNGMIVDKKILDELGLDINNKLNDLTNKIYELAGEEFNISSPIKLGEILFEKLNIAKGKKNKRGYKTDADTLEKYKDEHPIIEYILEYRALAKLSSAYIEGLKSQIHEDGKIHTIFKQTIARTGRLSSVEPNLQNIPVREENGRLIRKAFIPENDLFISFDYSQIELRILAHITGCKNMIETFNNDGDIHAKVASDINDVDISNVTKDMRSKAKAVIFGIVYGISSYGLKEDLHISKEEAEYFINKYYLLYPEVKKYMTNQVENVKKTGYVTTMFNRKRKIEELSSPNYMIRQTGERMAINTPIQGTAADIIKMAMIKVYEAFEKENIQSKIVLQIHDELIFDVKNEEVEKIENIVKNVMENVVKLSVPLKVSEGKGINSYEAK